MLIINVLCIVVAVFNREVFSSATTPAPMLRETLVNK